MKIQGISFNVAEKYSSLDEWFESLQSCISQNCERADILVFPELMWLALADFISYSDQKSLLKNVATLVWDRFIPEVIEKFQKRNKLILLGSAPRIFEDKLFNSAPIIMGSTLAIQDKIYLTPWEENFSSGLKLNIFKWNNLTFATAICFDVEHPYLAEELKKAKIDLLLVPSTTSDRCGNQRVLRCASARSVEIGCATIVVPLVGKNNFEMIDVNVGEQGYFLPSQIDIEKFLPIIPTSYFQSIKSETLTYNLPLEWIKNMRLINSGNETRPFLKNNPPFSIQYCH